MKQLSDHHGRWLLADPQLAVDLVGTQRRRGDALAAELPADDEAAVWVRDHLGRLGSDQRAELINLRALLRELFTAIVDTTDLPAKSLRAVNQLAAQAPVSLAARRRRGSVRVMRTSSASSTILLRADIARSALALLSEPARGSLRLCRAPGCTLFFLTNREHQLWCSASCGNRARVARHYALHHTG